MSEKTAEKKPCAFSGRAVYNENAIKAFCKVQYSAFKKKNQILIVLLGIALIVLAVCGLTKGAASIVIGVIGCWVITLRALFRKAMRISLSRQWTGSSARQNTALTIRALISLPEAIRTGSDMTI